MPGPWRPHVVGRQDEGGLHTHNHSIPDLERLEKSPGLRLAEYRLFLLAVSERVFVDDALVVDESPAHHDTPRLIHQEAVPVPHPIVEEIVTRLEALLDLVEA